MSKRQTQRGWKFVVVAGIFLCLLLLLVSHPSSMDAAACFLLIPVLFFGIPVSHRLLSRMAYLRLGNIPDAPALPSSFQRPPPPLLA
jgi:hypothetical protein